AAKKAYTLACSSLDKAAKKGLIPENRAARKKGQLARLLSKVST
ncbi:MAG: 30S ribosomal protein S20, partial [Candidatus Omnitrophica bacterium]|nr:30S ribosomal protein S20 [Candidatus Omnitrophota bacterium]